MDPGALNYLLNDLSQLQEESQRLKNTVQTSARGLRAHTHISRNLNQLHVASRKLCRQPLDASVDSKAYVRCPYLTPFFLFLGFYLSFYCS